MGSAASIDSWKYPHFHEKAFKLSYNVSFLFSKQNFTIYADYNYHVTVCQRHRVAVSDLRKTIVGAAVSCLKKKKIFFFKPTKSCTRALWSSRIHAVRSCIAVVAGGVVPPRGGPVHCDQRCYLLVRKIKETNLLIAAMQMRWSLVDSKINQNCQVRKKKRGSCFVFLSDWLKWRK